MIRINLLGDALVQVALKRPDKDAPEILQELARPSGPSLPIGGALLGLAIASMGGVYFLWLNGKIEAATRTQVELQAKKKDLEKYIALEKTFQAQKAALAKKKEVMMGLKLFQHLPVHLLEELANSLPDDVWFKEISQKGMAISIKGESTSFEAVNLFRSRLIERNKWFANVNQPAANKNGRTIEFTISCDFKNPA